MALKVWDGFDHYNATADFLARSGFLQWQLPNTGQPTLSFVTGRNGIGKALKVVNPGNTTTPTTTALRGVFADRNAEAYFRQPVLIPAGTVGTAVSWFVVFQDTVAGSPQITVKFNGANYSVQVFRGDYTGTSLALSANNAWTGDIWNNVEFHAKIANSGGVVDVQVRGVSVFGGAVTGLDTQNTANAWFDAVDYYAVPLNVTTGAFIEIDDFSYNDTVSGAGTYSADGYMGDAAVKTLFATGNGTVQWTPLTGTNWGEVAEQAMDSDTSYNSDTTSGHQDLFTFTALGGTISVIYGIQVTFAGRKDDGGSRVVKSAVKSSSTTDYGANHSLPDTNYAYFSDIWVLDPNTSATWTLSGVNGATFGYNLVS